MQVEINMLHQVNRTLNDYNIIFVYLFIYAFFIEGNMLMWHRTAFQDVNMQYINNSFVFCCFFQIIQAPRKNLIEAD